MFLCFYLGYILLRNIQGKFACDTFLLLIIVSLIFEILLYQLYL